MRRRVTSRARLPGFLESRDAQAGRWAMPDFRKHKKPPSKEELDQAAEQIRREYQRREDLQRSMFWGGLGIGLRIPKHLGEALDDPQRNQTRFKLGEKVANPSSHTNAIVPTPEKKQSNQREPKHQETESTTPLALPGREQQRREALARGSQRFPFYIPPINPLGKGKRRGGPRRKAGAHKKEREEKRAFNIVKGVEEQLPKFQHGFGILQELRRKYRGDPTRWEKELLSQNFEQRQAKELVTPRTTALSACCRYVGGTKKYVGDKVVSGKAVYNDWHRSR